MNPATAPTELCAHIWERAKSWVFDRTVAIYIRMPDGYAKQWGSGVLLEIQDAVFLVSASHVMEIAHECGDILIGSMNIDAKALISIDGGTLVRTSDQEKLDLAYVRLPEAAVKTLAPFKRFVQISEVDLRPPMPHGPPIPHGCYYIAGYPVELTQTDHSAKRITVGQYTLTTHLADSDHAHHGISIAVSCSKDTIVRSGDGGSVRAPGLKGVSGCGIWRLWATEHLAQLTEWNESWIRLAGIEHRVAGEAIVGTMASHVIKLILHTQPVELTLSHQGIALRLR